jgi:hypothetical protein
MSELSRDIERELAALADGSLPPERREQVLAKVRRSRELQGALAEQRSAVEMIESAQVRAPASLRRRVEETLSSARPSPAAGGPARGTGRSRARGGHARTRGGRAGAWGGAMGVRVGVAAGTAVALAAAALAIGLLGGSSPGLSVQRAAALTLSRATMPAPAESRSDRAQLAIAVGGVSFPYWKERFGWRSTGVRSDHLGGHAVTTVFYANAEGVRIGYAIASGTAPAVQGGSVVRRWGVPYRVLSHDGAVVVTWRRAGHLCVVSGRGVSAQTLLSLASWDSDRQRSVA